MQDELLGANLFAYCSNNPVNYSDPSGYARIYIGWISTVIDIAIVLVPALIGINKLLKAGKAGLASFKSFQKLIKVKGKKLLKKVDDWLWRNCATEKGYLLAKLITGNGLIPVLGAVLSIGGLIQYVVDCLDGKWDDYLDTKSKNFGFHIILKRSK